MYPKVKVREDRDEDHKRDVAVDHKVFASLPIRVSSSSPPVKEEQQDVSHRLFQEFKTLVCLTQSMLHPLFLTAENQRSMIERLMKRIDQISDSLLLPVPSCVLVLFYQVLTTMR
ncbi:uncharacterized protein LOC123221600 [Mangifera indica]|uniref:uncharacterized protein LOC123221600 n=1 Tax=Mangifera indica TaxID=29780 RepID=UPI001CFA481F|nr:uncharacterized protein LOC123221600 [Mangifera indica]